MPFIDEISQASLRAVNVFIHKPSILEPETFREPHRLYFYAVRHLLERISWLCRDTRRPEDGDGSAEIVFSNRSGMSYDNLKEYLLRLQELSPPTSIDWSAIRCDQLTTYSAGKRMGLQIADAVASGFFKALEPSQYGHTEDKYARMLRPIVYNNRRCFKGYGLKFWPREAEAMIEEDETFRWMREVYLPRPRLQAVS